MTHRTTVSVLVALAALTALSCKPEAPARRWNVLLVVVDTLRADHTSLYGYERRTSPGLERLAARSVVFDNALAQAGCTFPSVNSMLTSRYPQEFLARKPRRLGIPQDIPTLAETLRDAGYDTAALSASRIVRGTPSRMNRFGGFGRGFDRFDESCEARGAACMRTRTLEVLDTLEEPFFVYSHFMEPHDPYSPPRWHEREFATAIPKKAWVRRGAPRPVRDHLYRDGPEAYDDADIAHLRDLYDEEILHFDRQFELFLAELEERGLEEETLIVIASDHGEAFLEHGEYAHCRNIAYNSVLRTPLLIALPGGAHAGRRTALAQNLDLVPTLLDYLGIASDAEYAGRSLRPVIEEHRPVHRYLFSGQGMKRVITDGRRKLIYDLETETVELFDWEKDPGETTDLSAVETETVETLRKTLFGWIESLEGEVGNDEAIRDAQEIESELRAVGYL